MEKQFEIPDLPPDVRQLVAECEVNGAHTIFTRNGHPVAILLSHDEYLALRETIEIGKDEALRRQIERAEADMKRGAMILPEEFLKDEG